MTISYRFQDTDGNDFEFDVDFLDVPSFKLTQFIHETDPDEDDDDERANHYIEVEEATEYLDEHMANIILEVLDYYTDPKPYVKWVLHLQYFLKYSRDEIVDAFDL